MAFEGLLKLPIGFDAQGRKRLAVLALVVIGMGLLYYLVSYGWSRVSQAQAELQKQQQELDQLRRQALGIPEPETVTSPQSREEFLARIPPAADEFGVHQELAQISLAHGLKDFRTVTGSMTDPQTTPQQSPQQNPQAEGTANVPANALAEATRDFLYLPIDVFFLSDYASLGGFLQDLAKVKRLLSIEKIDVKRQGAGLAAQVSLRAYFRRP